MLTTQQAADALGTSRQIVQKLIGQGRLKAQKLGRDYFIEEADLDAVRDRKPGWVKGRPRGPRKKTAPKAKGTTGQATRRAKAR